MINTGKIPDNMGFAVTRGVIDRTRQELSKRLKFPEHIYADHNREVRTLMERLTTVPKIND